MLIDHLIPILFAISVSFQSKTIFCLSFCEHLTLQKALGKTLNSINQMFFFNHHFNWSDRILHVINYAEDCMVLILLYHLYMVCAKQSLEVSEILQGLVIGNALWVVWVCLF